MFYLQDKKGGNECEWEEKRVLVQVTVKQAGILHWIAYCHFSEVWRECSCVLWMNKSLFLIGQCLLNSDVTDLTDRHCLENRHLIWCRFTFRRNSLSRYFYIFLVSHHPSYFYSYSLFCSCASSPIKGFAFINVLLVSLTGLRSKPEWVI